MTKDNKQQHQTQTHAHTTATHNSDYKKFYTVSSEDYTEVTITNDNYPQMFTEEIQLTHKLQKAMVRAKMCEATQVKTRSVTVDMKYGCY